MPEMDPSSVCVLFRFHRAFDVCAQHLRLLRALNPGLAIYGLYGGTGAVADDVLALLDGCTTLPYDDPYYNYKNGDLCVRWWFREVGQTIAWSHLCVIEWDMLFLYPLPVIYHGFESEAVYLALSGDYQKMVGEGWPWIQGSLAGEIAALLRFLEKQGGTVDPTKLSYGIFGGCAFPRRFLTRLIEKPVPSFTNDEVRLSFYAALFEIPLFDIGFLTDKRNKTDMFEEGFTLADLEDVQQKGGVEIHPFRQIVPDLIERLQQKDERL